MPIKKFLSKNPVLRYRFILEIWKLSKLQRWASQLPIISWWIKYPGDVNQDDNDAIIIPIQEAIRGEENTVLPYQILEPLVQKAAGHILLGRCPCRNAEGCRSYPHDLGCLFLGESVREVSPKIGMQTDADGAMAHIEQALDMGLVPMIVHASFDAELISVPYDRMLAICFCCDCCCTIRHQLRLGPPSFDDTVLRLPGLTVLIGENCTACGICHAKCPVGAIHFEEGLSVINQDRCKGCGLCAAVCPEGGPQLRMDESVDVVEKLLTRIRSRTEIGI